MWKSWKPRREKILFFLFSILLSVLRFWGARAKLTHCTTLTTWLLSYPDFLSPVFWVKEQTSRWNLGYLTNGPSNEVCLTHDLAYRDKGKEENRITKTLAAIKLQGSIRCLIPSPMDIRMCAANLRSRVVRQWVVLNFIVERIWYRCFRMRKLFSGELWSLWEITIHTSLEQKWLANPLIYK